MVATIFAVFVKCDWFIRSSHVETFLEHIKGRNSTINRKKIDSENTRSRPKMLWSPLALISQQNLAGQIFPRKTSILLKSC